MKSNTLIRVVLRTRKGCMPFIDENRIAATIPTYPHSVTAVLSIILLLGCFSIQSVAQPTLQWILLEEGTMNGSCESTTDCENDTLCYALQYIPDTTGTLTSYTTGFFINCNAGLNPITSNSSCVMTDNSNFLNGCIDFDLILFNCSGNQGNITVTDSVPVILHQICFDVPESGTLTITEDDVTDLTTSITLAGGMALTEFPDYTPYVIDADVECALLPLTWMSFTVQKAGDRIALLKWQTADEVHTTGFEVERSADPQEGFMHVGSLPANHTAGIGSYTWKDPAAMPGINYYRIRQIDEDGRYTYSAIRSVTFDKTTDFRVSTAPNPAFDMLIVEVFNAENNGQLTLIDMTGRQMLSATFSSGNSQTPLNIRDLPAGMYSLVVTENEQKHIEKVVVIH